MPTHTIPDRTLVGIYLHLLRDTVAHKGESSLFSQPLFNFAEHSHHVFLRRDRSAAWSFERPLREECGRKVFEDDAHVLLWEIGMLREGSVGGSLEDMAVLPPRSEHALRVDHLIAGGREQTRKTEREAVKCISVLPLTRDRGWSHTR